VAFPGASILALCTQSSMNNQPTTCPNCGSSEVHCRKSRGDWNSRLDYVEFLQWRDFGEAYQHGFRRLLEAIEAARTSPEKVWRYRRWDDRLQPLDSADYLFTKRRDFCGRERLFQEIEQWRAEARRGGNGPC
jgi:hypothetical protein